MQYCIAGTPSPEEGILNMSAIIDISLATVPFNVRTEKKKALDSYIEALDSCGVNFFEINSSVLPLLEDEDISKRFILRVSSLSDLDLCRSVKFAYISLPIHLSCFFEELSEYNRIIAEVNSDKYSAHAMLMRASSEEYSRHISMLRLISDSVSSSGKSMTELISWYREHYMIPLDICPLNSQMTGFICASSALKSGADAITLAYGCDYYYSSLEDFYINSNIMRHTFMPKEILVGICKASGAFLELFEKAPCGIEKIGELEQRIDAPVFDIARGTRYFPYRTVKLEKNQPAEVVRKKVKDLGYDERTEEYILELLRMARLMN